MASLLDVVVIGGGLSGVFVGHRLQQLSHSFHLLEVSPRLGGRLCNDDAGHGIDLGAAWLWPRQQPHLKQLLRDRRHDLPSFEQPDDASSTRLVGGTVELVKRLASEIPDDRLHLNSPVQKCVRQDDGTVLVHAGSDVYRARYVVLAMPPRMVNRIVFDPPLSEQKQRVLRASHTWMAGVTKVALVYPTRFWDPETPYESNLGLPGSPAFQVYDSSTEDGRINALTFFSLVTPDNQAALHDDQELARQCAKQMQSVWNHFGKTYYKAQSFADVYVKRWPLETYISEDPAPTQIHPHPSVDPSLAASEWDGHLLFAGSESDLVSPGVMEGAIGAAKRVVESLTELLSGACVTSSSKADSSP